MKKALITGINGQDGAYLANLLLKRPQKKKNAFKAVIHWIKLFGRSS